MTNHSTLFWFGENGKITKQAPALNVRAECFTIGELLDKGVIRLSRQHHWNPAFSCGIQLKLDEKGRVIVEKFDELGALTLRERKIRVIASSVAELAAQKEE